MKNLTERLLQAATSPVPAEPDPTNEAIADAALRQFELFGLSRSTMDEISRRAKIARVTLYRRFPGKDALIDAVMQRELRRFLADLDDAVAPYDDADDRFVEGFIFVLNAMRSHRLLQRVLESEPETILPNLTVQGAPFLGAAREYLAARLLRDYGENRSSDEVLIVADIVVRLLLSFLLTPQTLVDLDDPDEARAFALRYLRPLLLGAGQREP
ncbi:MAG: TetR/AcrR family transcriptional regulator [Solirubrobacterales bacterium]|nr:TetR/AcrR family transcriptional regulator [Solirubrobacterales bacterium]